MLAYTLDNRDSAAVADGEALADLSRDEELAGGGAVQDRVPGEHVAAFGSNVAGADGDRAAGEAFADVIVCFTVKIQREALGKKSAEALSGGAMKFVNRRRDPGLLQTEPNAFAAEMAADAANQQPGRQWLDPVWPAAPCTQKRRPVEHAQRPVR